MNLKKTAHLGVAACGVRILHVVARSLPRGAELVAIELADELDARGHTNRIVALTPADDGTVDPRLTPLVAKPDGPWVRVAAALRLRRLLTHETYDVVLAHGGGPALVAVLAMPRGGPVLVWQRILGFPASVWHGPRRRLWHAVATRVDAAVALTVPDREEMRRIGFTGPVWVIPNFRRPERFLAIDRTAAAEALRAEIGVTPELELVGFVGHLVPQKRPERALEVLVELQRRGRKAHLVVAGDGPLRPRLEEQVQAHGLDDAVSLLGHRDDVELVFGGVAVSVLTSDAEGMPGVAIEAQMTGCPVVSFPVGGVDEVLEHGVTGEVLARPDTTLMAERVARILEDPALGARMSEAARERGSRFTAAQSAVRYEASLQELVDVARTARSRSPWIGRRHRSPGWLEQRLPNLFVLGAPKAGTTFLHQALRLTPEVFMSEVKEPGFFMSREYRLGLDHYVQAYFRGAQGYQRRGESTPWYLYSDAARHRIADLPGAFDPKLVVLVRRPADRAFSMHRDQVRIGREVRPFDVAVAEELDGLARGDHPADVRQRYVWCGLYTAHIGAWQETFGPDSVEVVVFEDLDTAPTAVWTRLAEFLEQDLGPPTLDRVDPRYRNPSGDLRWPRLDRAIRSLEGRDLLPVELAKRVIVPGAHRRFLQRLGRLNREPGSGAPPADAAELAELDAFYAPELERIELLLGRTIDSWRVPRTQTG